METGTGRAPAGSELTHSPDLNHRCRSIYSLLLYLSTLCREAAGSIPESAREPSPVYPAGRVGTPADPNIPPGRESSWEAPGLIPMRTHFATTPPLPPSPPPP
jgi:hypothetical protein